MLFGYFLTLLAIVSPTELQLTADVLEAALEGVEQLAGERGDRHHLKLQYVESAQTQVKLVVVNKTLLHWVGSQLTSDKNRVYHPSNRHQLS